MEAKSHNLGESQSQDSGHVGPRRRLELRKPQEGGGADNLRDLGVTLEGAGGTSAALDIQR